MSEVPFDDRELVDGDRDQNWPEGFYWSEAEGRPVYAPQRGEAISEEESARKQLAWMNYMERVEREVFPDARPRSEVIVEVEEP